MAYEVHIEPSMNCVFIYHIGDFVPGEAARAIVEVAKNPKFRDGMNILRDMRQTKLPQEIDYQFFKSFQSDDLDDAKLAIGIAKLAWVVGNRDDYILVHQVTVKSRLELGSFNRKAFRDIEKAKEWLGIPADYEIEGPAVIE